jgi:MFS family permease
MGTSSTQDGRRDPGGTAGFRALRHQGFRVYFAGMLLRGTAVWMQMVSLPWAAVELGAGPAALGVIAGLQFLPTLIISPLGGVLADRYDRARILIATQMGSVIQGLGLFALSVSDSTSLPALAMFALSFGVLTAVELPVRQAYVTDLVPRSEVTSAVSLHSTAWNTTRFIGPALAGLVIATLGVAASFLLSAFAQIAVTASLLWLSRHEVHRLPAVVQTKGVLRSLLDGARFAMAEPRIRTTIVLATVGNILGIQVFQTLAPLYVNDLLGLGGGAYGVFMALWGAGAVVASYVVTIAARNRRRWMVGVALGLAAALGALSRIVWPELAFLIAFLLGFTQIALIQNAIITVQVITPDEYRGRIMGLYTTVFQGTSPIGAFVAGALGEAIGVRGAMTVAAVALSGVVMVSMTRRTWRDQRGRGREP